MTISTESYTAVAGQARQATEKSVDAFKNVSQPIHVYRVIPPGVYEKIV